MNIGQERLILVPRLERIFATLRVLNPSDDFSDSWIDGKPDHAIDMCSR